MEGKFDSRHPLVGLVDETSRLHGRLKSVFAQARQSVGLGDSEIMVLNAVVEAQRPPSVAQIGRSLGYPRQIVQRAANSLVETGLIAAQDNPDHKRSPLFVATKAGEDLKHKADALAEQLAEDLLPPGEFEGTRAATAMLRAIRKQLEAQIRSRD